MMSKGKLLSCLKLSSIFISRLQFHADPDMYDCSSEPATANIALGSLQVKGNVAFVTARWVARTFLLLSCRAVQTFVIAAYFGMLAHADYSSHSSNRHCEC